MKLYIDEDLSPVIAEMLRGRNVDAVSAHETGGRGLSDEEQLRRAGGEGRCLVTRNRDDFIRLTLRWYTDQQPHFGVLIIPFAVPSTRFAMVVEALATHAAGSDLPPYTIDFL